MNERFTWKDGTRFGVKAQVAGERLASLREANGGHITPAGVVEDARPEDAPLHPVFTWDDAEAAERYREEEARHLIRSVRVVHTADDGTDAPVLGYVHVNLPEEGPVYVSTARAMSDADLREQAEADALAGLRAWQSRYQHIAVLAPIVTAIEAAVRNVERRRKAPRRAEAVAATP